MNDEVASKFERRATSCAYESKMKSVWVIELIHPLMEQLIKSTTRHVRIFSAEVNEEGELVPSNQVLTLDVDPDNEFNWNEDALQKVYRRFDELVESHSGADLTDYNLRRIGSELEHFMRSILQSGQISYNLNSRALNYSMGLPQVAIEDNK